jgi:hypothetical protein
MHRKKSLDSIAPRDGAGRREVIAITVENAVSCALANVLASHASRAGRATFARARRTPWNRKTP